MRCSCYHDHSLLPTGGECRRAHASITRMPLPPHLWRRYPTTGGPGIEATALALNRRQRVLESCSVRKSSLLQASQGIYSKASGISWSRASDWRLRCARLYSITPVPGRSVDIRAEEPAFASRAVRRAFRFSTTNLCAVYGGRVLPMLLGYSNWSLGLGSWLTGHSMLAAPGRKED